MSLGGDLAGLFVGNFLGWGLVVAVALAMAIAIRKRWFGWAFLVPFSVLVAAMFVSQLGAILWPWVGALATVIGDVWMWFLIVGTAALVLIAWRVLWQLQARHAEAEPRGKAKVLVAIGLSLLLGLGGYYELTQFEEKARNGTHDMLIKNLNRTVGEGDYLESARIVKNKPDVILKLEAKIQLGNETIAAIAAGTSKEDPVTTQQNQTEAIAGLAGARKDLHDAQVKLRQLTPNHLLWVGIEPLLRADRAVRAEKDAQAEEMVLKALSAATITEVIPQNGEASPCTRDTEGFCLSPFAAAPIEHSYFDAHDVRNVPVAEAGPAAFEQQREFNEQRDTQMEWFVAPGLSGLFLAPFAFVGGHILNKAYEPSTSVGFKKYPGKAAGLFLLCMAGVGLLTMGPLNIPTLDMFGILAIPFAAWVLRDLHNRSLEGQIAL